MMKKLKKQKINEISNNIFTCELNLAHSIPHIEYLLKAINEQAKAVSNNDKTQNINTFDLENMHISADVVLEYLNFALTDIKKIKEQIKSFK